MTNRIRSPKKLRLSRKTRRLLLLGLLVMGAGTVAVVSFNTWMSQTIETPISHASTGQIISVPPGATVDEILGKLVASEIVSDSWSVRIWVRMATASRSLKAGDYTFPSPISPRQAFETIFQGKVLARQVTFPEGLSRFEVARTINALEIPGASEALGLTTRSDLIQDLDPAATDLEGYLFPDTYQYTATTTAAQLIERMVGRFKQVHHSELRDLAHELGFTVRQTVTLASMIEKEARVSHERALISSVYHNRLRLGMKLDCDPTVIYASVLAGTWSGIIRRSDLSRPSPYNTYMNAGLPPGPISSPGLASLTASLRPAETDYLYFVVDATSQNGTHRFSATAREHQANVALYRKHFRRQSSNLRRVPNGN